MLLASVRRAALGALVLGAFAPSAHAQLGALGQDASPFAIQPVRAAQGDAFAAAPSRETVFFGNPAHLSYLDGRVPKVNLTITAGVGGNVRETYEFYDTDLGPAIEQGLDTIRDTEPERLDALYREALRVGASQKTARSVVDLSGTFQVAGVGVGVGVMGTNVTRAQMVNGGAGVPFVDLYSQADLLVPVGVSYRLAGPALGALAGLPGVPSSIGIGVQGAFVNRWLAAKAGAVDTFDPDGERLYLFSGSGVTFDLGLQAEDVGLPGIDLGLAVTNVLGQDVSLGYDRSWAISGSEGTPEDQAEITRLETRFAARDASPGVRAGVSYRIPVPFVPGLAADRVRVSADYTSASTSEFGQSFQAGLRLGAQARFARILGLRAGVSQGLPSAGASLMFPGVRVDYATYGVEDGALLGQLPRRSHVVSLRFGVY